ncbi:MAG TPA: cysteine hydrolase [Opitutaceae bacterium]|nr:cysteine hydrolase [Opitutaceae bacterium]
MRPPLVRLLPADRIRSANTALLVIDLAHDFVAEGAVMQTPGGLAIIPAVNRLAAWTRSWGGPVIFTHEAHRPDRSDYGIELEFDPVHCLEGTPGADLVAGLDVRPSDYHIHGKRRYDCFLGTELDLLLRCRRIENVVACGVTTHQCVMSTVFTARHLDYRVLVAADACAGVSADHHAAALLCMSDVFGYITDVATLTRLSPA